MSNAAFQKNHRSKRNTDNESGIGFVWQFNGNSCADRV